MEEEKAKIEQRYQKRAEESGEASKAENKQQETATSVMPFGIHKNSGNANLVVDTKRNSSNAASESGKRQTVMFKHTMPTSKEGSDMKENKENVESTIQHSQDYQLRY